MCMTETISIIVPVYKVEKYLEKCIDSIVKQSYRALDIILVDDGSPDHCGEICDAWAKKDKRIRVIHKQNGGLSDARNAGIEVAIGDFFMFVDSDDYIANNMVERLYCALKENNTDMSICGFEIIHENDNNVKDENKFFLLENEVITGEEALIRICQKGAVRYIVAWNKLYNRILFEKKRFPVGKIHEDEFLAHHILGTCKKISTISDICYFYVQRSDSIMSTLGSKSDLDSIDAYLDRSIYFYNNKMTTYASTLFYDSLMRFSGIYKSCMNDDSIKEQACITKNSYLTNIYLAHDCSVKQKVQLYMFCRVPKLFNLLLNVKMYFRENA